ncbi:MAG: HAMP domain-containing sensor histidine kinase [Porticoccaceae bacterium]
MGRLGRWFTPLRRPFRGRLADAGLLLKNPMLVLGLLNGSILFGLAICWLGYSPESTQQLHGNWLIAAAALAALAGGNAYLLHHLAHHRLKALGQSLAATSGKRKRHLFLPSARAEIASALQFHFEQLMLENEQLFSEIQEREAIYNSILNTQEELVFIIDKDGYISYRNRAFDEMFGAPSLDFDDESSIFSENLSFLMQQVRPLFSDGQIVAKQTHLNSIIDISGKSRYITWTVNAVTEVAPARILFVGRDETDEMEIRRNNERLQRIATVGRAASTIFHEINQPLSIMQLSSFMIKSDLESMDSHLSPDARAELLHNANILEGQISRANEIISNLRLFHSGDRRKLTFETIPLGELVGEALSMFVLELRSNGIDLDAGTTLDSQVLLNGNRTLFTQVLVNILKNSIQILKETDPGHARRITLSASTEDQWIAIRIEDTGPGIPEADLVKATEPFFTTRHEGSGLGLALCLDILNSYGGTMDLKNRLPHGLATTVRFPLADWK